MCRGPDPSPFASPSAYDPVRTLTSNIDDLNKTIAMAIALTKAGRTIDLAGLEHSAGVLCAKALDLMPHEGRSLRPALIALSAALDTLVAAIGQTGARRT